MLPTGHVEYIRKVKQHPDYGKMIQARGDVAAHQQEEVDNTGMNSKSESY
jgi:ribosomal protein S17